MTNKEIYEGVIQKWELFANEDFNYAIDAVDKLLEKYPHMKTWLGYCSYCNEFTTLHDGADEKNINDCVECPLYILTGNVCEDYNSLYSQWLTRPNKINAKLMLDALIKSKKHLSND